MHLIGRFRNPIIVIISLAITLFFCSFLLSIHSNNVFCVHYIVNPQKQELRFYWKDQNNKPFKNFKSLNQWIEQGNKTLVFGMNGGMYKEDNSPLGLYMEDKKVLTKLNVSKGAGNFYLHPNGVFYITVDKHPFICTTQDFRGKQNIQYATQSGPMLLINGKINPAFKKGSMNINIRNGAGILPGNQVLFAMSRQEVNLYDFAKYFQDMGCRDALYLDGFVSRIWLPEKNYKQPDGNFGVIIGVTK